MLYLVHGGFMVKKALIIALIAIAVVVIVSIVISIVNLKPLAFQSSVAYDSNFNVITTQTYERASGTDLGLFSFLNFIKYERTIMTTLIVLVILFTIVFLGTQRSRG